MMNYSEIPADLQPINNRHINAVDKLYRMHVGASTHLTAVSDGCFELETRIDHRKRPISVEQLAKNIARSWQSIPELSSCPQCLIRIYQSAGPTGFFVPAKELRGDGPNSLAKALFTKFQQMGEAEKLPAPLIAEYSIPLVPRAGSPKEEAQPGN